MILRDSLLASTLYLILLLVVVSRRDLAQHGTALWHFGELHRQDLFDLWAKNRGRGENPGMGTVRTIRKGNCRVVIA